MHKNKYFFPNKKIDQRTLITWNNKSSKECTGIAGRTHSTSVFLPLVLRVEEKNGKKMNTLIGTLSHWTFFPVTAYLIQEESEHS